MTFVRNSEFVPLKDLSFLWLEITQKCNLECLHCYADSSPREDLLGRMDTQTWLSVLEESATLGCSQVQFIGGEPTLHPDLPRMIRYASACGYSFIEVFTNATRFDECFIDTFIEHRVDIATSFYSDVPDTHDAITRHHGSFARTVSKEIVELWFRLFPEDFRWLIRIDPDVFEKSDLPEIQEFLAKKRKPVTVLDPRSAQAAQAVNPVRSPEKDTTDE
jgi:sulfatase maturation enzyme AslB (radical SAM superfamily)